MNSITLTQENNTALIPQETGNFELHIWNPHWCYPMGLLPWVIFNVYPLPVTNCNCERNHFHRVLWVPPVNNYTWGWFWELAVVSEAREVLCAFFLLTLQLANFCNFQLSLDLKLCLKRNTCETLLSGTDVKGVAVVTTGPKASRLVGCPFSYLPLSSSVPSAEARTMQSSLAKPSSPG